MTSHSHTITRAKEAARYALAEIAAYESATRHGLPLTAAQCLARAHEKAAQMRAYNRTARAQEYRLQESALRRAVIGGRA